MPIGKQPHIGADTPDARRARRLSRKLRNSPIVYWLYGLKYDVWRLVGGYRTQEIVKAARTYHESRGRKVRIYRQNIRLKICRVVYETKNTEKE